MKILLIDNYDSFTFNLRQLIEECGVKCDVVKNDEVTIEQSEHFDKILISPGPGTPEECLNVCELIKSLSPKKSILGICLGHQTIAYAFGAELMKLKNVCHGIKKRIEVINEDYLFDDIPSQFDVGLYHSWAVASNNFPACLKITALSEDGGIMALSHKTFDVKGIQFHPESVMTEFGKKIIQNWIEGDKL